MVNQLEQVEISMEEFRKEDQVNLVIKDPVRRGRKFYSGGTKKTGEGSGISYPGNPGISFLNGGVQVARTSYNTGFGGSASNRGGCGRPQGDGGYSGGSSYGGSENNGVICGSFYLSYSDYICQSIAGFDFMPSSS